jgi:DNA-binding CsgD family transcriptional regulator
MGEESVRLAEDIGEGALLANNLGYLARFQAALGDTDAARANAERVLATCRAQNLQAIMPHAFYALGLAALASGQHAEAVRHLAAVTELDTFSHEPGLAIWDQELIEALLRAGNRKEAEARLHALEHDVNVTGRPRGHAIVGRLRGLLADEQDLDREFGEALRWHERTRLPFEQARTRLAYGERLRRARRRSDARVQLGAAVAAFEQLGARSFAAWARAELRAAGAREEHAHPGDPWNLLTAQEARVVEVVAGGATYQEAADSLFLSPRTIEHHLRNAYRKLGIRSRSELAMRVAHQRGGA